MNKTIYQNIDYHFRAANYLTVAQLFLRDNVLLKRKLKFTDLKPVVLGHWGACPAINFLYTHFCRYIRITKSKPYLVLGSGHAAPALLANLYLERSLGKMYPDLDYGNKGLFNLISKFGLDPRLQTEISPALPGVIYSGGEIGNAVASAIGILLNNPKTTCFCIIGDGEFEAGVTIPSLLCKEFLFPKKDGFLILAINLNKYKMGGRSLLSTWSRKRIESFFFSFGIKPFFCKLSHENCAEIFNSISVMYKGWIKGTNQEIPVIILENEKGVTGPEEIDGRKFVGTHRSHKVDILKHPKIHHVKIIEQWLKSYKPEELFESNGFPVKEIQKNLPPEKLRIGRKLGRESKKEIKISFDKNFKEIGTFVSPMEVLSEAINNLMEKDKEFLLFSPDEGISNRLESVIEKNNLKGNPKWDSSVPVSLNGRVIEVLNESCCHGMLQGYNQTGRDGIYITYEAFAPITSSLISQYYKFLKISNFCKWRPKIPSLKYVLTSLGWQNVYTHQNPDLLNTLFSKTDPFIDVYFPCDANQLLACFHKMLTKRNSIQVMVVGKTEFKVLRSRKQAYEDVENGSFTITFGPKTSTKKFYIIAIGDYMVKEAINAAEELIRQYKDLCLEIIVSVSSKMFKKEELKKLFKKESNPQNVIVLCTGYVNIFKGLFGSAYDIRNWKFLGYKDGFSLKRSASILELNEVTKENLIKYIKNQLSLSP